MGSAADILVPKPLDDEDAGRVNILLAGNSFDDEGHDGAALTDSIMVASMDITDKPHGPDQHPAGPVGRVRRRPDEDQRGLPVRGLRHAGRRTLGDSRLGMNALGGVVQKVTGLHIDQYVLVGYTALKDTVDAVGGIDVVIASATRAASTTRQRRPAAARRPAHLDGTDPLKLARARNHPRPGPRSPTASTTTGSAGRTSA